MSGKSTEYCSKQFLGTCDYLKEAQKEIAEISKVRDILGRKHNELVDERNKFVDRAEKAEAKIEAANKILEALVVPYHIFSSQDDWLVKLRDALYIPRKENQEVKPCH